MVFFCDDLTIGFDVLSDVYIVFYAVLIFLTIVDEGESLSKVYDDKDSDDSYFFFFEQGCVFRYKNKLFKRVLDKRYF